LVECFEKEVDAFGWVGGWLGSKALLVEEEGDTTAWVLKKKP
jgi:hypothetical protein